MSIRAISHGGVFNSNHSSISAGPQVSFVQVKFPGYLGYPYVWWELNLDGTLKTAWIVSASE